MKRPEKNSGIKSPGGAPETSGREERESGSRGKGRKIAAWAGGFLALALVMAGGAYAYLAQQYKDTFFPNTTINGMDASGKTVEEVKKLIEIGMSGYRLTVEGREGLREEIAGVYVGLFPEYDGSLEQILAVQNPYLWGLHWKEGTSHWVEVLAGFDQEKLQTVVEGLVCMDEDAQRPPADARLSEYIPGTGYEIIPEGDGTQVEPEIVLEGISEGIRNLKDKVSLEEMGAYRRAAVTAQDPQLLAMAEAWNRYATMEVTYQFGDAREVLDGSVIHTWMTAGDQGAPATDDQGLPVLDEARVAEYVSELAKKYNTAYKPKTLRTTYGPTVTITGGNYGWRINQKAEVAALMDIVRSGQSQEREPVYSQTAASHGETDYGDTYVEINLTAQHLYFYKDGALVVDSDFVSGNVARGHTTPPGAFPLTYKQRNAVLKGEGYASPVSYWMPFNGGIGMHDASWRGSFGGKIYRTNGSHGCVNLPASAARTIFEGISAGMPVLCYNLEGTSGAAPVALAVGSSAPGLSSSDAGSQETGGTSLAGTGQNPGGTSPASGGKPAQKPAPQPAVPAVAPPAQPAPSEAPAQPAPSEAPAQPVPPEAPAQPQSQPVPETVPDPAQTRPQESSASVITAETGDWQKGPGIQSSPAAPQPSPVPETVPDPSQVPSPQPVPGSPGSPGGPGGDTSSGGNGAVSAPGM